MVAALLVVPAIARGLTSGSRRAGGVVAARQLARRRRRDGGRRPGVAGARLAHPGEQPAVGVGHERQQHLVADLRLQRARPARRAGRAGPAAAFGGGGGAVRRRRRARCGCSTRRSAGRPAGCSASRSSARSALAIVSRLRRGDARTGWLHRRRRLVRHDRGRVQHREGHLPPLLRVAARAVHRRAGRRRRRESLTRVACSRRWRSPAGVRDRAVVLHDTDGSLSWVGRCS